MSEAGLSIDRPSPLRPRAQLKLGALDAAVIARAEAALQSLSGQFDGWLQAEVDKLDSARVAAGETLTPSGAAALYGCAHDLKGLGGTYLFPIVTRIAGSLARVLNRRSELTSLALIDAHIAAIHAVVRDGIRADDSPSARLLVEGLEAAVTDELAAVEVP